jgi:hypothetical protein
MMEILAHAPEPDSVLQYRLKNTRYGSDEAICIHAG